MELSGVIKVINDTQTVGTKGFKKRELVITTQEQYPQTIQVEFVKDKCDLLDKYKVGQSVKIQININGREWISPDGQTKYFNSIQGWKIDGESQQDQNSGYQIPPEPANSDFLDNSGDDDLPF